jgi:hypothetical protein
VCIVLRRSKINYTNKAELQKDLKLKTQKEVYLNTILCLVRQYDIAFKNGKVVCWDLVYFKEFARIIQKTDSSIKWGGNFGSITDNPHFEI